MYRFGVSVRTTLSVLVHFFLGMVRTRQFSMNETARRETNGCDWILVDVVEIQTKNQSELLRGVCKWRLSNYDFNTCTMSLMLFIFGGDTPDIVQRFVGFICYVCYL